MKHLLVAKFIMLMIGLWRLPLESLTNAQNLIYKCHSVFMQSYFICFVVALYLGIFPLGKVNIEKTMEGLAITILCTIVTIKAYICQRKGFTEIISYIVNYENKIKDLDEENYIVYKSYALYTKKICITLFTYSSLCGVTLVISKFILYTQQLKNNNELDVKIEKPLPYVVWRPVDEKDHYFTAFSLDTLSAIIGCTFNTVTQLIFLSIMTFIAGQLEILQRRFKRYGSLCSQHDTFEKKFELLKSLIVEHQQLIA